MSSKSNPTDPSTFRNKLFKELGFSLEETKLPGLTMTQLFFNPDEQMLNWLNDYARGRLIMDLGCGTADLIKRLKKKGARIGGVEPHWDMQESQRYMFKNGGETLQILPYYIEEKPVTSLFTQANDVLFLVCRPSHGGWPAYAAEQLSLANSNSEILLIQKPDTFYETRDMKPYDRNMRLVPHEGSSEDKESCYSFISVANFPDNVRPGEDLFLTHKFD